MSRIVRGALVQATWTGDKESMIQKHEQYAHEASKQGAQVILFQELFYGPYFCQVQDPQYFAYTEHIPDGPTTKRMQDLAKRTGMVVIAPMYEEDGTASGIYYNTAEVIDADGTDLGKYRKTHIPQVKGFWEKYYFRPGNLGYPVFQTAVGKVGVYICYDRHFPEGARALGLNGAEMVFIPSATSRGLSEYLWRIEQPSHAVANGYFVGTINRVGIEPLGDDDFYGQSYFVDPRGQFVGAVGDPYKEELIVRDMDSGATETLPGSPALGPSITADGRLVAYAVLRWPPNAVVVDGFAVAPAVSGARLTVYDRETGAEVWGLEIPSESLLWGAVLDWPRISPNGRWVSFRAVRLPGVDEDTCPVLRSTGVNGAGEGDRIFIHDLHDGVTHCVPLHEAPGTVDRLNSFSDAVTDESVVFGYTILEAAQSPSGGQRVVETRLARYNPATGELAELGAPNDITFDTPYSAGGMALAYVERSHPPAGTRIVLMDPFGHDTRFTADSPYRFQPAVPRTKREVAYESPALSADGRHIAYVVRGVDRDSGSQAEEIYVTSR